MGAGFGFSGARVEFTPRIGQGNRPPRTPLRDLAGPGAVGPKPHGCDPYTLAGLGADVSAPLLGFGAGAWGQERPEEAGVSESLGRGLPDCTRSRGLAADLEALHRGRGNGGKRMPSGFRPGYVIPGLPSSFLCPLTFWV